MQIPKFIESFNYAIEGCIYVLKTQRNMRVHVLLGILIFILGIVVEFTKIELICLGGIITIVFFAEMLNTAIEHIMDLISSDFHPRTRIIKDIAAGSVLLVAIGAIVSGYILFSGHLSFSFIQGLSRLKDSPYHATLITLILVLSLVILGKVWSHRGRPLMGGMPSGHSATAFAIWAIISQSTTNSLIVILSLILAVLIAASRVREKIHSLAEVSIGALLGFSVAVLIIQLFK